MPKAIPEVSLPKRGAKQQKTIESLKARADAKRTFTDRIADLLTQKFGTFTFLVVNAVFFFIWLVWNTGLVPGLKPIDPFPFGLLTTVVSLEAIFLAIIVLISQNRAGKIAELREEVDLYINTYAENEITKVIYLLTLILDKQGVDLSKDIELKEMLGSLESSKIEEAIEEELTS